MSSPIMKTQLFKNKLIMVEELSLEELRTELEDRSQTVGPLLDSTIKVYQRQLARLLAEETRSGGNVEYAEEEEERYSNSDLGYEDEEDEDERNSHVQAGGDSGPRQRPSAQKSSSQPQQTSPSQQTSKAKGLVPIWVQSLALLILSLLIFAIWYNMEESGSSTPKITTN
ncbi:uncharacterized protein [Antedon mediterranea]|uniref:uncharacterized protein isoform X2 n=1 Tax=Antedon mediterranea TaxID=105859 RepID=UPI003AF82A83